MNQLGLEPLSSCVVASVVHDFQHSDLYESGLQRLQLFFSATKSFWFLVLYIMHKLSLQRTQLFVSASESIFLLCCDFYITAALFLSFLKTVLLLFVIVLIILISC